MEAWRVSRPEVADSHHPDEEQAQQGVAPHDPDPDWDKKQDPNPHCSHSKSTALLKIKSIINGSKDPSRNFDEEYIIV